MLQKKKKTADFCLLWIPTFGPQQAMGNMLGLTHFWASQTEATTF